MKIDSGLLKMMMEALEETLENGNQIGAWNDEFNGVAVIVIAEKGMNIGIVTACAASMLASAVFKQLVEAKAQLMPEPERKM